MTGGGLTYSPDTVEALSDAILRLLHDQEQIKTLGENGKKKVPEVLSLEKMSVSLSAVYNGIMNM